MTAPFMRFRTQPGAELKTQDLRSKEFCIFSLKYIFFSAGYVAIIAFQSSVVYKLCHFRPFILLIFVWKIMNAYTNKYGRWSN